MGLQKHVARIHGNGMRGLGAVLLACLALVLPGCSIHALLHPGSSTPATAAVAGFTAGRWAQQHFPTSVAGATPGQMTFAAANVATGYACIDVQPPATISATPTVAATSELEFFTTTDSGTTWQSITTPTLSTCASSWLVAPDSANASDVFFLANATPFTKLLTVNPGNSARMALFRSLNGGQSWQTIPLPKPTPLSAGFTLGWNPVHMTISAHDHRIMLATTTVGIGSVVYASNNDGKSWITSASPHGSQVFLATARGPKDTLLALTGADYGNVASDAPLTLWRTSDGVQWTSLATLPQAKVPLSIFAGVLLATSPDAQTVVCLALGEGILGASQPTIVFRSQDGGTTWKGAPSPLLGTAPLGITTGALLGTNYSVTNDGTIWLIPIISDDYLRDKNYVAPGIYDLTATSNATWQALAFSAPGWEFTPQTFFAISQAKDILIFWTSFAANGVGVTASGIYRFKAAVPNA